jgi:hypothetical protein
MEINIMLIIDYLDEGNMPAEKPNHRVQPVGLRKGPGTLDPQYRWAQDQQRNLQQVAQNARLLKLAKNSGDSQK